MSSGDDIFLGGEDTWRKCARARARSRAPARAEVQSHRGAATGRDFRRTASELLNSSSKVFPGGLAHEIARLINLSSGSERERRGGRRRREGREAEGAEKRRKRRKKLLEGWGGWEWPSYEVTPRSGCVCVI